MTTNENVSVIKKSRTEISSKNIAASNLHDMAHEAHFVADHIYGTLILWNDLDEATQQSCLKTMLELAQELRELSNTVRDKAIFYHDTAFTADILEDGRISPDPADYL